MKNILSVIIALFALILTGSTKETPKEGNEPRTVVVSVTMESPEDTRVSLTPTATTPHGIALAWEENDKLMLCFEYNGNYYHNDAPIVASSIRNGGKVADFSITIPGQIPSNVNFHLYAVYQKTDGDDTNGGYFQPETRKYQLETNEYSCLTLNQEGRIPRPMLYFSKKNILKTANPDIGTITLNHSGWMVAIHLKNSTGIGVPYPRELTLGAGRGWIFNGRGDNTQVGFDFGKNQFWTDHSYEAMKGLTLYPNYSYYPLSPYYGETLSDGGVVTFYRWIASSDDIPELTCGTAISNPLPGSPWLHVSSASLKLSAKKPITKGKVYHIYTELTYNADKLITIELVSPY